MFVHLLRLKYSLFLLAFPSLIFSQVDFITIPSNLQMFPRDTSNLGHFTVSGIAEANGFLSSSVYDSQTNLVHEIRNIKIVQNATFSIEHTVPAKLSEYNLEIIFTHISGQREHIKTVKNLLAGDFFIVAGQSNAEGPGIDGSDKHDSTYLHFATRTIGTNFSWATTIIDSVGMIERYPISKDCQFFRPSSIGYATDEFGFSGFWPIKLQYELALATGIPNCVVNGARGGTEISAHWASQTPSDPKNLKYSSSPQHKVLLYDRLFKKLHHNNVISGVKGIYWYQGESDGALDLDSSAKYGERFHKLYTSWKADFPAVEKIFVLQINTGCGGDNLSIVREEQRKLTQKYADVVVMSTVGSPPDHRSTDNCHYNLKGYSAIADKLLPLTKKYIYDFQLDEAEILPANIQLAYYKNQKQICLEFDKEVIVQQNCRYPLPDSGVAFIKDYFFNEVGKKINLVSVEGNGNKVCLNLTSDKEQPKLVTYLPQIFSNVPSGYAGPWILNANNPDLGAYSFANFPIQDYDRADTLKMDDYGVLMFPNPAGESLFFLFKEKGVHRVKVYNLNGTIVRDLEFDTGKIIISLTDLPTGLYVAEIILPSGTNIKKKFIHFEE